MLCKRSEAILGLDTLNLLAPTFQTFHCQRSKIFQKLHIMLRQLDPRSMIYDTKAPDHMTISRD